MNKELLKRFLGEFEEAVESERKICFIRDYEKERYNMILIIERYNWNEDKQSLYFRTENMEYLYYIDDIIYQEDDSTWGLITDDNELTVFIMGKNKL